MPMDARAARGYHWRSARQTMAKAKTAAKPRARKAAHKPTFAADDAADAIASAVAALNGAIAGDRLAALPPELVQKLIAAAIRAYSAKVQAGEQFPPYDERTGRVAPTDVMITASGLLKAADLQVFELGMWQSYTGR
jgi:hypothetical protein